MKFTGPDAAGSTLCVSLPVRGAWVEIEGGSECGRSAAASLPVRGAWVEMPGQMPGLI